MEIMQCCYAMRFCGLLTNPRSQGRGERHLGHLCVGQKKSMTVHLVNLTNPMMMKGPLREVIPLAKQKVRVVIPKGNRVTRVRLLVGGHEARHAIEGNDLVVEIDSIGIHEVVALDLA